ncbi:MAG: polyprenyl synthetase family protein [Candidatus Methanomethylophilaceae archaeon]|nr:polyprenyl synthetase family protein [Candidatus Methanomethylophilaceae archaeon]MBQ8644181.1 polyprenyl synthetase family protein [Candidatus Methanomethylophilaceae archaeon]MBR2348229.1 polyprenyl synthetase family protein [Candidatus Methanomethylophilaceae archaeon]
MDAKEYLKKMSAELDGPIKSYIGNEEPPNLMDASKQYPYAGGKRMRPAMAVACCGAVGGDRSKAVPLAVAIEYIHNFTLIHDDLMDGDEKRRGMDTIHVNYGMPTAVLAGDALFAKAFQIICDLDIPAEKMREVLRYVSQSVWDLARGQQMDVNNEGQIVTEDVYIETIKLKTSVLFAAAAAGGAIIGGADDATVKAINEYALETGLGFQMYDDYLGVAGDSSKTGKSVGNDIRKGKCTCMITHAIRSIKDPAVLEEFKSILGNMDATDEQCARAKQILEEAGSIDYALNLAKEKVENAIAKISGLPEGEDKEFMIALARYAIDRDV